MFEKTRIKLTTWYLLIIMTVSLLFSLIIYSMINIEFTSIEHRQAQIRSDISTQFSPGQKRMNQIIFLDVKEARFRLISRLALINLGILIFAGGAGYFLAGRTLRPIKEALEEQNRFITDSSHELRTPLTTLRTEIEVCLMNKKLTLPQAKKALASNLEEVMQLQLLSDRLLELSIKEEKLNEYIFSDINIEEIINEAINKTKKLAENKKINLDSTVKPQKLHADREKLIELFVILIENAIKYNPKNSKIEIYSKKSRNHLVVFVKDNGKGIPKDELPHIFDRFYRTDNSRNASGFGLGLSIAKKITKEHGGNIKAESKLNQGSTFIVTLPI